MAEQEDQSSKTEEPTDHKLRKLREDGNVPKSKEVNNLFMLVAMLLVVGLVMPWQMGEFINLFGTFFQAAGTTDISAGQLMAKPLITLLEQSLYIMAPVFIVLMVFAYFGGIIQNGPILSSKPIQPKLSNISLASGFKRLFSMKSLAEFLKSLFKLTVIGAAVVLIFRYEMDELLLLVDMDLIGIFKTVHTVALYLLLAALVIMFVLAIVDYLFERMQYTKQNRMSRKEMKDEYKDTEGDPYIKSRQRQLRMERAQQRMMQNVPDADVVITNPTHYAVALAYKPDEGMAAPVVLAMGVDFLALRIREAAEEHDIPRYEDPPLARQLYASAELEQEIPLQLFEAVAKVIAFVNNLKAKKKA